MTSPNKNKGCITVILLHIVQSLIIFPINVDLGSLKQVWFLPDIFNFREYNDVPKTLWRKCVRKDYTVIWDKDDYLNDTGERGIGV